MNFKIFSRIHRTGVCLAGYGTIAAAAGVAILVYIKTITDTSPDRTETMYWKYAG